MLSECRLGVSAGSLRASITAVRHTRSAAKMNLTADICLVGGAAMAEVCRSHHPHFSTHSASTLNDTRQGKVETQAKG